MRRVRPHGAVSRAPKAFLPPASAKPTVVMFGLIKGTSPGGVGFIAFAAACRCAVWLFSTTLL